MKAEVGKDLDHKHEITMTLTITQETPLKINTLSLFPTHTTTNSHY